MVNEGKFGVALVGCGIVGGGTARVLTEDIEYLQKRTGIPFYLKYVVDKNFDNARSIGIPEDLYEEDFNKVIADPDVFLVVELIGGLTVAKKIMTKALEAGKHVVTANKALLAHYGPELFALARQEKVSIGFEASCGGGIPIVKALTDGLLANRIEAMFGIVNGTCNHILTEMSEKGQSYKSALQSAQKAGLAEADPTLDVTGMDSAHKLTILGSLAFGERVNLDTIPVQGIDTLDLYDVETGKELGYIMKLLAVARKTDKGLAFSVSPCFLHTSHPLARVSGAFNAVSVYGHAVGHTMYMGRGAGSSPTASAVVADIIATALEITPKAFETLNFWPDQTEEARQLPPADISSRYYLRFMVKDRSGTVARISSLLSEYNISITALLQREETSETIPLVMTTHEAREGDMLKALAAIEKLEEVMETPFMIRIIEEHPEQVI
ncbi:MAG: homoserine dehydrogenase [Spirochaetales bacterium]|nr:homoserine dehydrogenase [Spirochaetales bacterium]